METTIYQIIRLPLITVYGRRFSQFISSFGNELYVEVDMGTKQLDTNIKNAQNGSNSFFQPQIHVSKKKARSMVSEIQIKRLVQTTM